MGLFSSKPAVDINPEYSSKIISSESSTEKWVSKLLAKCQNQLDIQLGDGETVTALYGCEVTELFVVTNLRLLRLKKNKESWPAINVADIARVDLKERDLGGGSFRYMVIIDTHSSASFAEQDRRRFAPDHFIIVESQHPNDIRQLAAAINAVR